LKAHCTMIKPMTPTYVKKPKPPGGAGFAPTSAKGKARAEALKAS